MARRQSDKLTRQQFENGLAELTAKLRQRVESRAEGWDTSDSAIATRRLASMQSFRAFATTYFPHYTSKEPGGMHLWLMDEFQRVVDNGVGDHVAVAAPRGHAKSTLITQLGTLWCIVTGRKKYPVIVMDALEQALPMLETIKVELEFNGRLQSDFPEACGRGRCWQTAVIVTANGAKIEVFGSGKKIRGRRHGPYRPDLAIGDDLENDENVESPRQRDKLLAWINKSLLSLGAADDSLDVFIIGTVLHYDAVLARLLQNPLWQARVFRAIEQWPDNMDLWDQWEEILLNQGRDEALLFYQLRKPEMTAGAKICWPGGTSLYMLMLKRARDGHATFDSEQQNDPVSGDDAPFRACITFWVSRLGEWIFYGAADPSLGKSGSSRDPSALLIGGYNRFTGVLDVVEALIKKRLPDRIISDVIELQRQYNCQLWLVENVQFQEFLRTELVKRSSALGVPVPARGVSPSADKILRIESLQPHFANGLIRLHASQHTLISQLKHFPRADHDDGPDALHMLWAACHSGLQPGDDFISAGRRDSAISKRMARAAENAVDGEWWEQSELDRDDDDIDRDDDHGGAFGRGGW